MGTRIFNHAFFLIIFLTSTMVENTYGGTLQLSDQGWKFIGHNPQSENIIKPDLSDEGWLSIDVPGDVNASLLEHGKIPDPHFDTQARELYWITSKEWWYVKQFNISDSEFKNPVMVFNGIDGTADIWLNDQKLGVAKNAFHPYKFDIKDILNDGINTIYIRFQSINELLGEERPDELRGWNDRRGFLRKPQFNFGWDWTLPLPSIGLSDIVYIEEGIKPEIIDHSIRTFKNGRTDFAFEVSDTAYQSGYYINLHIEGHGTSIDKKISRNKHKSYTSVQIPDPQLWFPNGYGIPNLYRYSIKLIVDDKVVDTITGRFGIREVNVFERPFPQEAGPGFSFEIHVNDVPIFCKGSNWIPCEIWPATVKPEQYDFYLEKAKEANFNMLRIWGGGIYENDYFYELCDELGIMVWEDFMFAGPVAFPVDILQDEIIEEADYQIRRLRNHPSIVIWCGVNEDIYSWRYPSNKNTNQQADNEGFKGDPKDKWYINRYHDDPIIFTMILRGMVSRFGLGVPYIESSPQATYDDYGNMPNSGNSHISSWKTALFSNTPENWRSHFEKVCSFDSEFCIQGPSSEKTIRSFLAKDHQWPPDENWIYHIQRGHKNLPHYEQTLYIAGATFGEINSLQEYVKHGQATHVEQTRAEYESARRDRPYNGGTMSWMYNDCWPTSNWSIIDYYRQEKPAFYAAKRACKPVLPIIMERAGNIEFFFGNDTLAEQEVNVVYGQEKLSGETVWSRSKRISVASNSTLKFDSIKKEKQQTTLGDYLFIDANINGKELPRIIYFSDGWKNINWPDKPNIKLEIISQEQRGEDWVSKVKISSNQFVRLCHILMKDKYKKMELPYNPELKADFSDNYFDLSAGREYKITIHTLKKIKAGDLHVGHWWSHWE